jgi:hypothetical protein
MAMIPAMKEELATDQPSDSSTAPSVEPADCVDSNVGSTSVVENANIVPVELVEATEEASWVNHP